MICHLAPSGPCLRRGRACGPAPDRSRSCNTLGLKGALATMVLGQGGILLIVAAVKAMALAQT